MSDLDLKASDYQALKRLSKNKDFLKLVDIMKDFQLKRASNLISGSEATPGSAEEELKEYRGGARLWKKVIELVGLYVDSLIYIKKDKDEKDY